MNTKMSDILTPEQAAAYLQVNRETIYRYIRQGRIVAAKLGRSYRIPRRSLDLLLIANRTRPDIPLREYSEAELAPFFSLDELDTKAAEKVRRWHQEMNDASPHEH